VENNIEYLPSVLKPSEDVLKYNKENGWPDVPAQTKVFLHEYAIVGNLKNACAKVNIGKDKGSRILRDPLVQGYLADIQEGLYQGTLINRSFVEIQYLEFLEQANGDVPVPHVTKDGDVVIARSFNANAKLGILRDMSQWAGMKKEQGLNGVGVTISIDLDAAGYRGVKVSAEEKQMVVSEQ
jgi:hypothetical protein